MTLRIGNEIEPVLNATISNLMDYKYFSFSSYAHAKWYACIKKMETKTTTPTPKTTTPTPKGFNFQINIL